MMRFLSVKLLFLVSGISIAQGNEFVIQLVVEIFRKAEMGISAVVSSDDVRYNDHTMDNIWW